MEEVKKQIEQMVFESLGETSAVFMSDQLPQCFGKACAVVCGVGERNKRGGGGG